MPVIIPVSIVFLCLSLLIKPCMVLADFKENERVRSKTKAGGIAVMRKPDDEDVTFTTRLMMLTLLLISVVCFVWECWEDNECIALSFLQDLWLRDMTRWVQ